MSTPNLAIAHIAAAQNQKEVTANTAFDDFDTVLTASKTEAMTDANFAVPSGDLYNLVLVFTGTLTADRNVTLPANAKFWIVSNQTAGGHNLIFKVGLGTHTVTAGGSGYCLIYCDGANSVYPVTDESSEVVTGSGPEVLQVEPILTLPSWTAYTVANLPGTSISTNGMYAFASNGRKVGEGPGSGTGVPVYFSNGAWRVFSTDAQVQS